VNATADWIVRPITMDDIAGYHSCLAIVARERKYIGLVNEPPLENTINWVAECLQQDAPYFVAEAGGQIVGWCDIGRNTREGFAHVGVLGTGVHPDWRGKGIGKALMSAALARARQVGLERIALDVFASNTRAIAFYERSGFVHEGVKRRGRNIDGTYDDVIQMGLLFD
jgi:RimJ/RimL family protein N-acetyltransferase